VLADSDKSALGSGRLGISDITPSGEAGTGGEIVSSGITSSIHLNRNRPKPEKKLKIRKANRPKPFGSGRMDGEKDGVSAAPAPSGEYLLKTACSLLHDGIHDPNVMRRALK